MPDVPLSTVADPAEPPFVHVVPAFPEGCEVQTFNSWQDALGLTDAQLREFDRKLKADLDAIAEAQAEAARHAHEVWIR